MGFDRIPSGFSLMNDKWCRYWLLSVTLLSVAAGCEIALLPVASDGTVDATDTSSPQITAADDGSGDSFSEAIVLTFNAGGGATVSALLSPSDDVDVYSLGPITGGDRITVDVTAQNGSLDPMAAVFDDQSRLVVENDDRDYDSLDLDSALAVIARHNGDPYYLGVAAVSGTGAYVVSVRITREGDVPAPAAQTLLLDFDGGSIVLLSGRAKTVDAFDAGDIHSSLAGSTDAMKDAIISTVVESFAPFDVLVLNTDDHDLPADGTFSRVLFGGFSARIFGEAQAVDLYNGDPDDEAVVYTEAFSSGVFSSLPSAESLGLAIGNVAAHEAGHLLGLNHVADPDFLMDTTGVAETLLDEQIFGLAPLDVSIFPIGFQDSALLLQETVGLATD